MLSATLYIVIPNGVSQPITVVFNALLFAHVHCMFYLFWHVFIRQRISCIKRWNENRFLAFGCLTPNAHLQNTILCDDIIVCSEFRNMLLWCFFFSFSIYT